MNIDSSFAIYVLADSGRHVAITPENKKVISHCLGIWKTLDAVPHDRTVRALFVKRDAQGQWKSMDESLQENDITISQLRVLQD